MDQQKNRKPRYKQQNKRASGPASDQVQAQQASMQRTGRSTCYCCGENGHETKSCKYRDKSCNFCHNKGHLERACIKKKKLSNKFLQEEHSDTKDESNSEGSRESSTSRSNNYLDFFNMDFKMNVHHSDATRADPMFLDVKINGQLIKMEFDLVLKGNKVPLIGRQWLSAFGLWPLKSLSSSDIALNNKQAIHKLQTNDVRDKLLTEFEVLFSNTPGVYNKRSVQIHVNPNTKPVALGARHVPYALKPKIEQELERLVKLGHLEKVESSEWATPIVAVLKGNDQVRICGDFKVTLNPHLKVTKRPFPRIDDIFAVMRSGSTFSQLDLPHAYMQEPIDVESRKYLTIATHAGLFRYTKMMEGTALAPGEFVQIMEECLQGIPNTIAYMDNIYVTGKTTEEHFENLRLVCHRLTERGLRLNQDKCDFMKERIDILGFVIDKDGLHKSKTKVKAMYEAPRPENTKQLVSFLGLINFYARFLKNRSDKLRPLFDCANKEVFEWTKECEKAF
ncbi:uncharacterized protein K02A2.6-like [Temnothorax curvispinosus]|uniref:Uncharacterized protein K02A2.6-like n=1 Tax=Temnothorax curvispinosus TaxID=300111 RepID=A0A6J1QHD4_9HYME|nr:uncharacterized protein K02A2.6-like [Temnothorax curvispinosus]